MSYKQRWAFDLDIEDDDSCRSISDLLRMADESKASKDYEACICFLRRTATSPAGKYKLAKLYMDTPELNMSQTERYCEAEKLLLDIHHFSMAACMDLSVLYLDRLERPIAALAYLLRAKNLGAKIDPLLLERCKAKIARSNIGKAENNYRDCYELGLTLSECRSSDARKHAAYFLQIVCDSESVSDYSGIAALTLAELFDEEGDYRSAEKYYQLAFRQGNPPILTKSV